MRFKSAFAQIIFLQVMALLAVAIHAFGALLVHALCGK